jgi:hypothetical protein
VTRFVPEGVERERLVPFTHEHPASVGIGIEHDQPPMRRLMADRLS